MPGHGRWQTETGLVRPVPRIPLKRSGLVILHYSIGGTEQPAQVFRKKLSAVQAIMRKLARKASQARKANIWESGDGCVCIVGSTEELHEWTIQVIGENQPESLVAWALYAGLDHLVETQQIIQRKGSRKGGYRWERMRKEI